MKLFILLPSGAYAAGFETTICNCTTPIRQEHLRIDDDHCQPIRRPTQRKANYAVWTGHKDGLKVRAYICSRWEKINHVTKNVLFQKIVIPDKRAINTTPQDECTLMAKTKRCDEPSEDGSWLRTVPAQVLNCMVEEITLLHGTDDLIDTPLGQ